MKHKDGSSDEELDEISTHLEEGKASGRITQYLEFSSNGESEPKKPKPKS